MFGFDSHTSIRHDDFSRESSIPNECLDCNQVGILINPEIINNVSQVKYYSGQITYPKNTPSINTLLRLNDPKSSPSLSL
jgi:hypothetical protein